MKDRQEKEAHRNSSVTDTVRWISSVPFVPRLLYNIPRINNILREPKLGNDGVDKKCHMQTFIYYRKICFIDQIKMDAVCYFIIMGLNF